MLATYLLEEAPRMKEGRSRPAQLYRLEHRRRPVFFARTSVRVSGNRPTAVGADVAASDDVEPTVRAHVRLRERRSAQESRGLSALRQASNAQNSWCKYVAALLAYL
jgi:hypothetical protein